MNAPPIPPTAVIRVSRGVFEPARMQEVERMMRETSSYLIPAIKRLDGLISYYVGASPEGSMVNVSIWEDDGRANQMFGLEEMTVRARQDAEAVGVTIVPPILNHPLAWHISPGR